MPTALITGASRGLGRALAAGLAARGWHLVVDARDGAALEAATAGLASPTIAVPGDVSDPAHRALLRGAVEETGRLDLLVNNASLLGPSPLAQLSALPTAEMERVLAVNTVAPLALFQEVVHLLTTTAGTVINISSDAAVEAYAGWGAYGASKAALDQLSAVLAVEHPELRIYAFDPGDMRTAMHQAAFPGEDISDRPEPETVIPAILAVLDGRPPSGRITAAAVPVVAR